MGTLQDWNGYRDALIGTLESCADAAELALA